MSLSTPALSSRSAPDVRLPSPSHRQLIHFGRCSPLNGRHRQQRTNWRVPYLPRRRSVSSGLVGVLVVALLNSLSCGLSVQPGERPGLESDQGLPLAERVVAALDQDPAASLGLGIEAVRQEPSCHTRSALLETLDGCYLEREIFLEGGLSFSDVEILDGDIVAAAVQDGTGRLYDLRTGQELARWKAHDGNAVLVSALVDQVATAGIDGRVCLYDRGAGEIVCTFDGPGGEITDLCLHIASVAVRGSEGPPVAYSVPEGEKLGPLPGASGTGGRIRRDPPFWGGYFEVPVAGGLLDRVRTWGGREDGFSAIDTPPETQVRVSAADRTSSWTIWAGDDRKLHYWDAGGGRPHFSPPPFELGGIGEIVVFNQASCSAPSLKSNYSFVAIRNGDLFRGVLADFETGVMRELSPLSPEAIVDAAFSQDGRRLAIARQDGVVGIWDVEDGHAFALFRVQPCPVELLWGGRGDRLLTRSTDANLKIWFGNHRPDIYKLYCHGAVREARFAPDGERALTLSDDGVIRVWETPSSPTDGVRTGSLLATFEGDDAPLTGAVFDESGALVLIRRESGISLWDPGDGLVLAPQDLIWPSDELRVSGAGEALSSDGTLELTYSEDGPIVVRSIRKNEPVLCIRGDGGAVVDAEFSPGPGPLRVIAAFEDGTACVWPVDPLPWAIARKPR